MKKMCFSLILCLSFIIVFTGIVNAASAEENDSYTFGQVENELVDYLNLLGENSVVGSKEYTDFIFNQYFNDTDKNLVERTDYLAITAYMSEYVYQYSLQEDSYDPQISVFNLDDIKNLTIRELKEKIAEEEAAAEKLAEFYKDMHSEVLPSNTYNVSAAKSYAAKWYNGRNPAFPAYSNDCANFVSQILFAGGMPMNSKWYAEFSYSSPSWRLVEDLYSYWLSRGKAGISSNKKSAIISSSKVGDVVQLKKDGATRFSHAMFVYEKSNGTIYLSGHTTNYLKRNINDVPSIWGSFRIIKM